MKNLKYIMATLMVALIVAFVLVGCKKEKENTDAQSEMNIKSLGEKHNLGLDFVFDELQNAKKKGILEMDMKSENNPFSITKKAVDDFLIEEFCESMESQRLAIACADSIYDISVELGDYKNTWFPNDSEKLSSKQKEILTCLNDILNQHYDLETTLNQFEIIRQRIAAECEGEEASLLNDAISIGNASCIYWYNHFGEWCQVLGVNAKWFNWNDFVAFDIGGLIGGGVAGGLISGGAAIIPGAIGGAISGSVGNATRQIIYHYWNDQEKLFYN